MTDPTTGQVHLIATLTAKPGHGPALFAAMEEILAPVRQEEGCIRYDLFADRDDPETAVMLEIWRDAAALEGHNNGAALAALGPKLAPILAQPVKLQFIEQRA